MLSLTYDYQKKFQTFSWTHINQYAAHLINTTNYKKKGKALNLTEGLLLTLFSATVCIALPKLLSTLLTDRAEKIKPPLTETLSKAPSQEVPTLLTES